MSDHIRWDLSELAPNSEQEFMARLKDSLTVANNFGEKYRGRISTLGPVELASALSEYEQLQIVAVKPQYYAHLIFAEDSTSESAKRLSQAASEAGNDFSRALLFFDIELMQLPENSFAILIEHPSLSTYRHYLLSIRKFQQFMLPEREEQLLKLKDLTGTTAFTRLFDELSASFSYSMEIDGELREFTGEELLGYLHHPDRELRTRSFSTFLEKHAEHSLVYTSVFNNIALDHAKEMEIRGYTHPMQSTNIGNELSDSAVENLMRVTEINYPLAQEYFKIKASLLGVNKLRNTDVYAPIAQVHRKYSYEDAKEMVVNAYSNFNPDYNEVIESLLSSGRVDIYPRTGKSGGAFCMGISPDMKPFMLLNYTENLRDVATIAHELGHALHFSLSSSQSMLNYHAPLPLAETASVFGEMLLTRLMLDRERDKKIRISLLCAKIEDIIATTFRQILLTRFEEKLHKERNYGLLTDSKICELWLAENSKLFGDAVDMIDAYKWGWCYISHFIHTRFYCYSYTFAELLVLALYRRYQERGAEFIPGYDAILRSGGSLSPGDTAALAGIDINRPDFWQDGYNTLGELIEELKALI